MEIFGEKNKVLIIMAHPDDASVNLGGTIARLISDGKEVRVVKATSGNKGVRQKSYSESELVAERKKEEARSLEKLGVSEEDDRYLDIGDGEVENTSDVIRKVVYEIRLFKPDILFTHNPEDVIIRTEDGFNWVNHRDHRNLAASTLDAAMPYSRDILFFPEQLEEEGVDSHTVTEFMLCDFYGHPDNVFIDITDFLDQRKESIYAFQTQYGYDFDQAKELTDYYYEAENGRAYEEFRYVEAD